MRVAVAMVMLVGAGWVASACGSSVFACESDEQCQAGAVAGQCQPTGYCSFPDEQCPTGQRYGESAPDYVANACVMPGEAAEASTGMGEEGTHGGEPPDPDLEGSTAAASETATTAPADDAATTEPDPDPTRGMGDEGTTTGPDATCELAFADEFEGQALSPMWDAFVPASTEVFLEGGQLRFGVGPTNGYVAARVLTEVPTLVGGWVRVHVSELEQPDLPLSAGVVVGNEECQLQLTIEPTSIAASVWSYETRSTSWLGEAEVEVPTWLQLRWDEDGMVHFEHSPDAGSWQELAAGTFPECGDLSGALVAGMSVGGELGLGLGSGLRSFDRFDACLP